MTSILLIEADHDIRHAIVDVLEMEQYDVLAETSIERGLELVRSRAVDLVLCDCGLQQGFESGLHRALKAQLSGFHPATIGLLATWPMEESFLDQMGAAFSLRKPFTMEQLLSTVASAVSVVTPREECPEAESIHRYFEALARQDWDALGRLCADDVEYHLPAENQFGQTVKGRDAFLAFSRQVFATFQDARFDDVKVYRLPSGWTGRYDGSWSTADGRRHEMPGGVIFRIRGGVITRIGVRLNADRLASLT